MKNYGLVFQWNKSFWGQPLRWRFLSEEMRTKFIENKKVAVLEKFEEERKL